MIIKIAVDAAIPVQIIKSAAYWLVQQGNLQWESYLLGEEDDIIKKAVRAGETFLVYKDKLPAATFNLSVNQNDWDKGLWGEKKDPAYYLHRVAVEPDHMGNGIGEAILHAAERKARRDQIPLIRLDCAQLNRKLNTFYSKNGYKNRTAVNGMNLYEKILA
ncbi:GNAT family N-acetyltransferase [Jeotgalibacillus proteolyticus]|nr:GNAT family N-acetyltransferase [Jeotgalibacillus proteolyticus]